MGNESAATILLVEDNIEIASVISEYLHKIGDIVEVAHQHGQDSGGKVAVGGEVGEARPADGGRRRLEE